MRKKLVKVEMDTWPFVKYIEYDELVKEVRGDLLSEALKKMRREGKDYAEVKCPLCGRLLKIKIEQKEEKR